MFKKLFGSAIMMVWVRDFVRIGTPIFVVPFVMIHYTDVEQTFYFWINILFAFAMVADAGISSVIVRATSYFKAGAENIPRNKKEFDEADHFQNRPPNFERIFELFQTSKWIYILIATIFVILLSTVGVANFWNLFEQAGHRKDLWASYGVLIVYFGIYMLNIRWSSFMRGLDFVAVEARFSTITSALRILAWIILLSLKVKPLGLTLALLGEGILTHFFLRIYITRWLKTNAGEVRQSAKFSMDLFKTLWPAAWRMGGIQLGNFFVERGNNILILQISDTALMANFTFTTWILKTVSNFSMTPVYSRLPVLYKFAAEKNFTELKKSAAGYMFLGLFISALGFLAIGLLGNPLLNHFHSDRQLIFPAILFTIMALTEFFDMHSSFHAGVYTSTNHIPFLWPSIISGTIIFIVGMYVGLPYYGLTGIILTRFSVQLFFNNWYAVFLNLRFLKWPFFTFIIDVPKYGVEFIISKIRDVLNRSGKAK